MLQAARVLARARTHLFCHPPYSSGPPRCRLPLPGLQQSHRFMIKDALNPPLFVQHFSLANVGRNLPLKSLHRLRLTSIDHIGINSGRRLGQIVGIFVGTSYLSRREGLANVARCEQDPDNRWASSREALNRNYQHPLVRRVVKKLWVPTLCVLTISMGWQYPLSLLLNLLVLMWSTKPSPASIYEWVEEIRQQDSINTSGLDRLKAQAAGVMHVEVKDNMLFCLARVTSLTRRSTLVGFLGDWWVIYSSSSAVHTGVKLRNLIPIVGTFIRE